MWILRALVYVCHFLLLRTCKHLSYDLSPHFSPKKTGTPQSHVAALLQAISQNRLAQNPIPFLTCPNQQYKTFKHHGSIPIDTFLGDEHPFTSYFEVNYRGTIGFDPSPYYLVFPQRNELGCVPHGHKSISCLPLG